MIGAMGDWRSQLKQAREFLNLSRGELALRTGVSAAAIKAYEDGQRHPKRPYLVAILDALKVDRGTRNEILASAGYATDGLGLRYDMRDLAFTVAEAAVEIEQYDWPAFLADEFGRVLCANTVAQRIWGVDLAREFTDPIDRHLVSVATMPRFADRCVNWDEAVGKIFAVWRDHFRGGESLDEPSPFFAQLVERLLRGDPKYVSRLAELWEKTPPIKVKMRWSYRVLWQLPGLELMTFRCFLSAANEPDGYMFHDWIPADEQSWRTLQALAQSSTADARGAAIDAPRTR